MASIHVLDRSGEEFRVAIHAAVPNTNNSAGVNWRAAIINSGKGGTTVLKDGDGTAGTISAAEKTQILAGQVLEIVDTLRVATVAGGGSAVNAFLDAQAARIIAEAQARLQYELQFYGATRA